MKRYTTYLVLFKLLAITALLCIICNCATLDNYKVPTKYRQGRCPCFYAGECWTQIYNTLDNKWTTDSKGRPMRMSRKQRIKEILDKAYRIMLESPDDAPHSVIWLVYSDLIRYNPPEEVKIRPRR